jgi:NitT/TauT family transport system ATP-binding protein
VAVSYKRSAAQSNGASGGISVEDVSFAYPGGVTALSGLDLRIPRNGSIAVVGPSGCGKSTLLQLLSGIRQPSAGRIAWPAWPADTHPMAMVFQTDTLLPWLTAAENVGLHFKFRRAPRDYVRGRVRDLLSMVGLEDFADAYPYELSGGMRRRVAFLAAVAPKPAALLLDEPFSSLDEPTRVAIHGDALKIMAELDMTVVLITHDLAEAITLCDEVVILTSRPGRVYSRHTVPLPREREPLHLRQTEEFLRMYGTLWQELSLQIEASLPTANHADSEEGVAT